MNCNKRYCFIPYIIFLYFLIVSNIYTLDDSLQYNSNQQIREWLLLGPFPTNKLDANLLNETSSGALSDLRIGDAYINSGGDTLFWRSYESLPDI
jgi:hypothetical protein